jgi:hypothetical protein
VKATKSLKGIDGLSTVTLSSLPSLVGRLCGTSIPNDVFQSYVSATGKGTKRICGEFFGGACFQNNKRNVLSTVNGKRAGHDFDTMVL